MKTGPYGAVVWRHLLDTADRIAVSCQRLSAIGAVV
jgi:hypothetical protein